LNHRRITVAVNARRSARASDYLESASPLDADVSLVGHGSAPAEKPRDERAREVYFGRCGTMSAPCRMFVAGAFARCKGDRNRTKHRAQARIACRYPVGVSRYAPLNSVPSSNCLPTLAHSPRWGEDRIRDRVHKKD